MDNLSGDNRKLQVLFAVAILTGLFLSIAVDQPNFLTVLTLVNNDKLPLHGVIISDVDYNNCRYYRFDQYLGTQTEFHENASEECIPAWEASLQVERLKNINESTDNPEINNLLKNATKMKNNRSFEELDKLLDKLEVEKNYSVKS